MVMRNFCATFCAPFFLFAHIAQQLLAVVAASRRRQHQQKHVKLTARYPHVFLQISYIQRRLEYRDERSQHQQNKVKKSSQLTARCRVLFCSMSPNASMALSSFETMAGSGVMTSFTGVRSGFLSSAITLLPNGELAPQQIRTKKHAIVESHKTL